MSKIIIYIITGLVLSGTVGLLLGFALTMNCGKTIRCIFTPLIALIVGFGIVAVFIAEAKVDETKWNDGYCQKCGTELKLFDIERYRGNESFYYQCENGHTIELYYLWETDENN